MIVEYVDGFSVPGLPKWPQMIVRGTPVTVEQAKEIIRRTDRSFTGTLSGNDHATNRVIAKKIGMPAGTFYDPRDRAPNYDWDAVEAFRTAWGAIYTEYVTNDWIACCFIGGPHGWCHPDGTIFYSDNVGKYPGVEDVARDWAAILMEFPILDLTATLMSGESCEEDAEPVCTITVRDGRVVVGPPQNDFQRPADRDVEEYVRRLSADPVGRECAIPMAWIDEWAAQYRAKLAGESK
jgi:hypothetical protein